MNELTKTNTMTSLQIAEVTGKPHNDVMKAIRKMETAWERVSQGKFSLTSRQVAQPNGGVRETPCYELTKTECLYIATKFNDEARAKLVLRWQELELANRPKVPTSFREALLLAAEQQGRIEEQQREIERQNTLLLAQGEQIEQKDRAIASLHERTSYLDQILQSKSTVTTTQIAADYGMSAKKFNIILRNLRIQRKVGGQWILYAPYNTMGYTHSETFVPEASTTGRVVMNTKWLQKGRLFLYNELKKNGIIPLIEQKP
ncbi:MAG: phage regulatory protein/antirepressor Ant [Muribaculaceae bacterium]|nr:phage regulatory protein/antirepressor Ant [Muribaculaceae bacterium]